MNRWCEILCRSCIKIIRCTSALAKRISGFPPVLRLQGFQLNVVPVHRLQMNLQHSATTNSSARCSSVATRKTRIFDHLCSDFVLCISLYDLHYITLYYYIILYPLRIITISTPEITGVLPFLPPRRNSSVMSPWRPPVQMVIAKYLQGTPGSWINQWMCRSLDASS